MERLSMRTAWAGLVVACAASGAAAQSVHKCIVNGQATYQATPCAGDDKVVPMTSGPNDQEVSAARAEAWNQRYEAATGRLRVRAAPPSPPPQSTSPTTRSPAKQSNCAGLDDAMSGAKARLEAAQGHADLAARPEVAARAQADIERIRQQAAATDCKLAR
jgi:hypothetical protein